MQIDKEDEERISRLLAGNRLEARGILRETKLAKKTPDYFVFADGKPAFYCEVKSIIEDSWLTDLVSKAPEGKIVGAEKRDPTLNRITTKIHEAVTQFVSINPADKYPNVLAFVNHNKYCGYLNLCEALTGNFCTDKSERYPIYQRYSEGRIREEKNKVDLYIWDDELRGINYLFTSSNLEHLSAICGYFSIASHDIVDLY
jgi:hypothetical protein